MMDMLFGFIKSDFGVTIAWLCTVLSTIYGLMKRRENKNLNTEITNIKRQESHVTVDHSRDEVKQNGTTNVYTKNSSGGMKINM